jgi:concanavalin A-like lectin/glucanase superfamily protein
MIRNLTVVHMLVLCSGAIAMDQTGLVAHYDFDKCKGAVVPDISGHGNDGKIFGGAKQVTGDFGSALEFNGSDAYVDCGAKPSLNVGKVGTIMFWFRPQATCQGGLVGWAVKTETSDPQGNNSLPSGAFERSSRSVTAPAAAVKANQRLVVSLSSGIEQRVDGNHHREALGLYISDGKHFDSPSQSNQHKAFFPPTDRWLFYAVTFNGRSVEIYRDGVHAETRFQTLIPDTTDVPMLIGKCFGMGGPSDYFKGLIDEVRIYNRPLSSPEVYQHYMENAVGRGKPIEHFGGVGIDAAAYPKPGSIFADLDYRSLLAASDDVGITAALCDADGVDVARARIRMLPVWGRAEAVVDAAKLPAGSYSLQVTASTAEPSAAMVAWPGRASGWENVKVLNNFCWELLNESPDLKAAYVFANPRRGWVYIATEAEGDMTLTLPGATPQIVRAPDKGTQQEVMRWLEPGTYRITRSGEGTLKQWKVRAVPILAFHHYPHVGPGTDNDHDFLVKEVTAPYNTILTHDYDDATSKQFRRNWAVELGRHLIDHIYPATHLEWNAKLRDDTARQQIWDYVTPCAGLNQPEYQGVTLDEFTAGNDRIMWTKSYYDEWTETLEKVLEDSKYAGHFVIPFPGYNMYDFEKSTAFLRMFIDHGSPIFEQLYFNERDTEEQAWLYVNESTAAIEHRWKQELPGYTELATKWLSYLKREIWNPAVDFKVHLEIQFEHFATRPEFFGLGGIGAYSSYGCNNEEYVRWVSKLCRHYGLEGNTERLSTNPYRVTHIRNSDFLNASDGWTLEPAEKSSMAVKSHEGYGRLQERNPYRSWTDTPFLWTKRSVQRPNVFSQEIRNLQAGELYLVRLWVGDYNELMAGASRDEERAVSLRVDGGDVWDNWYRTKVFKGNEYTYASYQLPPFSGQNLYYFKIHQLVFRANGPAARLVISDWKSSAEPGGPVGQELMFNFIEVHPYLPAE